MQRERVTGLLICEVKYCTIQLDEECHAVLLSLSLSVFFSPHTYALLMRVHAIETRIIGALVPLPSDMYPFWMHVVSSSSLCRGTHRYIGTLSLKETKGCAYLQHFGTFDRVSSPFFFTLTCRKFTSFVRSGCGGGGC